MTSIKQPTGIKTLTNVAIIKYKIENKKFEIACYKNKAINWRNGVEKNLEEVLQVNEIYINASHGQLAKEQDLENYFPDRKKSDIIKLILEKGVMQMGEKEREVQQGNLFNDIVNIIAEKCIHPDSKRLFSADSISKALLDSHIKIKQDIPAKRQALDIMKLLSQKYYMIRAQMKIGVEVKKSDLEQLTKDLSLMSIENPQTIEKKDTAQLICLIEPSKFRAINEQIKKQYKDGAIEVLVAHVSNKEVQGIEEVGKVELQVRNEWKIQELDSYPLDSHTKADKKKLKKSKNVQKPGKQGKKQENINQSHDSADDQSSSDQEKNGSRMLEHSQGQGKSNEEEKQAAKHCTTCKDSQFFDLDEYRQHFKSEWHLENVKRKLNKKKVLTELEYKQYRLDLEFQ